MTALNKYWRYFLTACRNVFHPISMSSAPVHCQVEVTTFCNLACIMCPHPRFIKNPQHLTFEKFKHIFDTLQPLTISLSGIGEPFLNPDMLSMIRYAVENGAKTITTTNLTVITPELAAEIVSSGLGLLKGSIDSMKPETYLAIRQRDKYASVIEGLRNIRDAKIRLGKSLPIVRLQFVIQGSNFEEIPDIIRLCEDLKVDAVNFQPLELNLDETLTEDDSQSIIGELTKDGLAGVISRAVDLAERSLVATNLPDLFKDFDQIWDKYVLKQISDDGICLIPWTSTYITVDGSIRPCCSFPVDESATLGNIFQDSFLDVWNSPRYQSMRTAFRTGHRTYKICKNCIPPTLFRLIKSSKFSKFMLFR